VNVNDADLGALAVRVSELILEQLNKTVELAQKNGARIEKLEHELARILGPDFYRNTAHVLLGDPKYEQLVARGYQTMINHATATFKKNVDGWLGKPFLDNREASKVLGITAHALSNMRKRKQGPRWSGSGKWVRYERHEIERWLRELPTTET
jgi:hypothetical protein